MDFLSKAKNTNIKDNKKDDSYKEFLLKKGDYVVIKKYNNSPYNYYKNYKGYIASLNSESAFVLLEGCPIHQRLHNINYLLIHV